MKNFSKYNNRKIVNSSDTKGAFFWDNSEYSYLGLGTTEYTEYQFPKRTQFRLYL